MFNCNLHEWLFCFYKSTWCISLSLIYKKFDWWLIVVILQGSYPKSSPNSHDCLPCTLYMLMYTQVHVYIFNSVITEWLTINSKPDIHHPFIHPNNVFPWLCERHQRPSELLISFTKTIFSITTTMLMATRWILGIE